MKLHKVQAQWRAYNEQHFGGHLQPIVIRITRSASYYGKFVHPSALGPTPTTIHISGHLNTEKTWRDSLLHEMVHQSLYEAQQHEVDDHGPQFMQIADRLGLDMSFMDDEKCDTIQATEVTS